MFTREVSGAGGGRPRRVEAWAIATTAVVAAFVVCALYWLVGR